MLIVVLLTFASAVMAAPVFVQNGHTLVTAGSVQCFTATFPSAVTVGNVVLVGAESQTNIRGTWRVTDSAGNEYTQMAAYTGNFSLGLAFMQSWFWTRIVRVPTSFTACLSDTVLPTNQGGDVFLLEYSGVAVTVQYGRFDSNCWNCVLQCTSDRDMR